MQAYDLDVLVVRVRLTTAIDTSVDTARVATGLEQRASPSTRNLGAILIHTARHVTRVGRHRKPERKNT